MADTSSPWHISFVAGEVLAMVGGTTCGYTFHKAMMVGTALQPVTEGSGLRTTRISTWPVAVSVLMAAPEV